MFMLLVITEKQGINIANGLTSHIPLLQIFFKINTIKKNMSLILKISEFFTTYFPPVTDVGIIDGLIFVSTHTGVN